MDRIQTIKTETESLLQKILSNFSIDVNEEEGMYHIDIKTEEEAPTIIGRHGETIRAIQKILEVVLYKTLGESVSLLVNVNDYREKQKERLQNIAAEAAERAQSENKSSYLRGFSSYERRIIHEYVTQNYPNLATYSVGEGRDRRLVIDLKGATEESEKESHKNE